MRFSIQTKEKSCGLECQICLCSMYVGWSLAEGRKSEPHVQLGQTDASAVTVGSPSSTSSACSMEDPCVLSPKRVPLKGVRYIACGSAHTVAVTDDATYTWGHGLYGALGHGTYEDKAIPTRVKALLGKDIEKVDCGQHHTLFLRR